MTPADREKLTKAFNDAVAKSPYADELAGGIHIDGKPATRRALAGALVKDEQFFEAVDEVVGSGRTTVDQIIAQFEQGMKTSNRAPKP